MPTYLITCSGADSLDFTTQRYLMALRTDGLLLSQVAPQFQADPLLVAVAIKQNWRAFSSASATLRNDRSFALQAVSVA